MDEESPRLGFEAGGPVPWIARTKSQGFGAGEGWRATPRIPRLDHEMRFAEPGEQTMKGSRNALTFGGAGVTLHGVIIAIARRLFSPRTGPASR